MSHIFHTTSEDIAVDSVAHHAIEDENVHSSVSDKSTLSMLYMIHARAVGLNFMEREQQEYDMLLQKVSSHHGKNFAQTRTGVFWQEAIRHVCYRQAACFSRSTEFSRPRTHRANAPVGTSFVRSCSVRAAKAMRPGCCSPSGATKQNTSCSFGMALDKRLQYPCEISFL